MAKRAINETADNKRRGELASPQTECTPTGYADELPAGVAPYTDLANAHRLLREHGNDLRHTPTLGWMVYDGRRFRIDAGGAVDRRVQRAARRLQSDVSMHLARLRTRREVRAPALARELKKAARWAEQSQQIARLRAARDLAATLPEITVAVDALDRNAWLLNVNNGTIDLRTGKLQPHQREDLITKLCPVEYRKAPCQTWEHFLARVFESQRDLIEFVQRALGYSLTGLTSEQCILICHGDGANGKSTLIETVRSLLGDYAMATGTDTLLRIRAPRGADNDVARLRGARFVSAVESGEGKQLDEERVKRLTGGDTVTARFLYREFFEFVPTFKIWVAVNDRPDIAGIDHGIWRRLRLIPFRATIQDHEQDRHLLAKLRAEASGILHWMVRGCLDWQERRGLVPPTQVIEATAQWREESDFVARFVDETCRRGEHLNTPAGALHAQFARWCAEQGLPVLGGKAFAKRLRALGYRPGRVSRSRLWCGLELAIDSVTQ